MTMEASTRFELVMTVLQTVALPLGDEAIEKTYLISARLLAVKQILKKLEMA